MQDWRGRCHRCGKESNQYTMSKFNTDLICMECKEAEKKHPRYREAVAAEERAVMCGNFNFQGVGWTDE